jgi:spermidine/putrescine transport system substrate-binding protein
MNHRYDGSTIDLERALVRYMLERRVSRRELLERVGKVGAAAALAPIVAACTGAAAPTGATQGESATPQSSPEPVSAAPSASEPAAVESELFIYNWTDYLAEEVIESFEAEYGVSVQQDFFSNTEEAYAKLGDDGGGYDISFPISVDVPSFIERGAIIELDKSRLPNIVNLGAEWSDPGYDPGNRFSVPYMWWTTGVGYDSARITEELSSSRALWDERWAQHISMLDDFQEVFGLALIQLGYSANTTLTNELDEALALLKQQKPLVRTYSTDTIATLTSGDVWIGHIWGADRFAIQEVNPNVLYYIPEEGGIKGSDTVAIFSGAQHPNAAYAFINHLLDAQHSAANTNFIYYMGPNAAAKEFIDPAILEDPTINPDQQIVDKLEELLNLEPAVRDEYLSRWQELRA